MPKRYEQILFRYSSALERGDFETVADVLREAERDPVLEVMLLELNEVYAADQTGRSNHKNPKELAMIAPLYEKRAPERVRTYNLPMVAALVVVALLGVLLATRIAPPTQWNTAQNGSPEPNVMQVDPTECEQNLPVTIKLYSRPSTDAFVTYEVNSVLYFPQSALRQLDAAEADGETWYFVSVDQGVSSVQGWMTAAEYNRSVGCAVLVNPTILAQVTTTPTLTVTPLPYEIGTPTLMATPAPFVENFDITATALIAEASAMPPTVVPPEMIAVVTSTPAPFDGIMPTVVPPETMAVVTATPTMSEDALPRISMPEPLAVVPTVVPPSFPEKYPVYTVQEGDTLFSILTQFNLSTFSVDELTFINNLPSDVTELPETLLIPVQSGLQLLTCVVDADESVDLFPYPAAGEATGMLQSGTVFRVVALTEAVNERWYLIMAQVGDVAMQDVWVNADAISRQSDCVRFSAIPENVSPVPFELTATPLPTALPPTPTLGR